MGRKNIDIEAAGKKAMLISAKGLKGKQSVRATFRLPDHVIDLLGIVASQLGLKQKSLFDQLVEDKDVLTRVAESSQDMVKERDNRRQKTYVISRKSLEVLDMVARQQKISRDLLVEVSIERLLPVINAEQEKHRKRKQIYKEMKSYLGEGRKLLQQAELALGFDDQASAMLRKIVDACEVNVKAMGAVIESGRAMEDFKGG